MPTPLRNIRVPDDVWLPAMERAKADGTALSGVIVDALRAYGSGGAAVTVFAGIPVVADERMPAGAVGMVSATDMAVLGLASGSVATLREVREPSRVPDGQCPPHPKARVAKGFCSLCKRGVLPGEKVA